MSKPSCSARKCVKPGKVILVGIGPGDAELLTLKALRAINEADVILYDALVGDDILALIPKRARLISVGKRAGCCSWRQSDINDLMLAYAKAGHAVVRLKSGDPSIFGRSGEEIAFLTAACIDVRVVPGVTAASAMAASLGISLTHRDCARSVRLITGHSKDGGVPRDLDWRAIADPATTTVFYMGAHTASDIVSALIAHGMSPKTPCMVAASIEQPTAQYRPCTLETLVASIRSLPAGAPTIFGIGTVFGNVPLNDRVKELSLVDIRA